MGRRYGTLQRTRLSVSFIPLRGQPPEHDGSPPPRRRPERLLSGRRKGTPRDGRGRRKRRRPPRRIPGIRLPGVLRPPCRHAARGDVLPSRDAGCGDPRQRSPDAPRAGRGEEPAEQFPRHRSRRAPRGGGGDGSRDLRRDEPDVHRCHDPRRLRPRLRLHGDRRCLRRLRPDLRRGRGAGRDGARLVHGGARRDLRPGSTSAARRGDDRSCDRIDTFIQPLL